MGMMDDLDELGYEEIKHRFDRGDYHDPTELKVVKRWLRKHEKEQEFIASCKRASISSALESGRAARQANLIAFSALLVSVIGARKEIFALIESIRAYSGH
ncbi:MAG: hypothetical protein JZU67_04920 [Burkholderiaceae bacterium]|nr:hypothetical protein [Burkholderiaceae bacterium]